MTSSAVQPSPQAVATAQLVTALKRLDAVLSTALQAMEVQLGTAAVRDPHRGLYIAPEDVARLLSQTPGTSLLWSAETAPAEPNPLSERLAALQTRFSLTTFDLDVLLIAIAPAVDSCYDRLYAYLQDDVTKKQPSVDLALNLLCYSFEAKLAARDRFAPYSPLIRYQIVQLVESPNHPQPSLLNHFLTVDERIVGFLLGQDTLDARLQNWVHLAPDTEPPSTPVLNRLQTTVQAILYSPENLTLSLICLIGTDPIIKLEAATTVCATENLNLLVVDTATFIHQPDIPLALSLLHREVKLQNALVFWNHAETLASIQPPHALQLLKNPLTLSHPSFASLKSQPQISTLPIQGAAVRIEFPPPSVEVRSRWWATALHDSGLDADAIAQLASQFSLTKAQIQAAVTTAKMSQPQTDRHLSLEAVYQAARSQSSHSLNELATPIQPRHTWQDLILPAETSQQLQELRLTLKHRATVYEQWGFGEQVSASNSLTALFAGPPGTGKTMAASILAQDMGLDLYAVDLSLIVSKYIGETEKNLSRIFEESERSNAILFFDEADALFGKRTEVRDSHDRYANLEVSYLLQRIEHYSGIVILASNLRKNIDEAFVRRMNFIINFPFPKPEQRLNIWKSIWPKQAPLKTDIDFEKLAHKHELAGGNIRSIALASAFLAAEDGQHITIQHIHQALKREYQKLGRILEESLFI